MFTMHRTMNSYHILFFATLKERTGTREAEVFMPDGSTVGDLKEKLLEMFPGLRPSMNSTLVAVNKEYSFDQTVLPTTAEIALFPPVSGGSLPTLYAITNDPIDLDSLLEAITLASTGAAAIFTGMVRGKTSRGEAHETSYLEYEAYKPMAEAKMQQVAAEIRQRWPTVEGIAIIQRIGKLYPRTPTVLIACTAAHRDTGVFEAARYGIDRLKEIVPVWKKEIGPNGEEWIEGDYIPGPGE